MSVSRLSLELMRRQQRALEEETRLIADAAHGAAVSRSVAEQILREVPEDPVEFCIKCLHFHPSDYQIVLLRDKAQFIAVRYCRQSGKTFTVSAKILHRMLLRVEWWAAFGPSFRQSKQVIRKITDHAQKLPRHWFAKFQKTKLEILNGPNGLNGSRIEAFPNNPDTIRGPTLNGVYADEFNFIANDEDLYDAILFTLGTTGGSFIASSTPWSRDHTFWKMCNDKAFDDYSRHHVTWKEAIKPNGPLDIAILEKIKRQLAADPWRWQREMEAEWSEDESSWLPQSLIAACQDSMLNIRVVDKRRSFWVVEQT